MHARIRTIGVLAAALAGVLAATAASADSLVDVPEDHPFHDEIHWAWRLDIADGYDDHTFRPTAPVSRQAFLAFLHRTWEAMGSPPVPVDGPAGFDDVPTTSGFHDDIIWAAQAGIANGHADGTFRPTATVSRQAAVAFLHRFWSHLDQADPAGPSPSFTDVGPTHPFTDEIAWAGSLGITSGHPDGTFRPGDAVARQTAVAFLHRLATPLGHEITTPDDTVDADPGDGTCADATGACSLRAAVQETNAQAHWQYLWITPGLDPIVLDIQGADEEASATGDLDITDDLAIAGNDAKIQADHPDAPDRVAHVHPGTTVMLRELDIAGGDARDGTAAGGDRPDGIGGGLLADHAEVVLREVFLNGNTARGVGGGIAVNGGALTVEWSSVSVNAVELAGSEVPAGGGIAVMSDADEPPVQLTIDTVTLYDNRVSALTSPSCLDGSRTTGEGGAISAINATVAVTDTLILDNAAGDIGGGLALRNSNLSTANTVVRDNTALGSVSTCALDSSSSSDTGEGGGIWLDDTTAELEDTTVTGNRAGSGGGLHASMSTLSLVGGAVADNEAEGQTSTNLDGATRFRSATGAGGGLLLDSSTTRIERSEIAGNVAADDGGGIGAVLGSLEIVDSTIIANAAEGDRTTSAFHCEDSGTWSTGVGGGIATSGSLALTDTVVTDNGATQEGGGIHSASTTTLERVSITGNTATGTDFSYVPATCQELETPTGKGGGLASTGGTLAARNTTIAGNHAEVAGGGTWADGTVTGTSLTVTANEGGGFAGPGTVTLAASILADQADGADCVTPATSLGWNLSSDASCGFTGPTDLQNADPLLTLAAPATFYLPSAASPVVDAISVGTIGLCDASQPTDQRGQPRPIGTGCDIGALERQPSDP